MSEQDLVNAILDWLRMHGAWAIRVNSGGRSMESPSGRYFIRMAPAGTPDIIFCWPGGLFGVVEAKVGKNKPTDIQRATLQQIREIGGLDVVAYSIDDVENAVRERIRQLTDMV